jgi:hypothetical protein
MWVIASKAFASTFHRVALLVVNALLPSAGLLPAFHFLFSDTARPTASRLTI